MAGRYAHKVVRVTLSGTMLQGNEEWQTGFFMGRMSADATAPTQAFCDLVRDSWATFFTAANSVINSNFTFTQAKCALLATDTKYDTSADVVVSFPATAKTGAQGGAPLPPQIALVATLIGGSGKGLAGKGRMYLPGVCDPVGSNGRFNSLVAQNIANNLATFFNTLDASIDAPGHVINASMGTEKIAYINAKNVPVNGVRVGDVYDTQRRRRNSLSETYKTAVVTD
jgi:hypothetical protein